MDKSMIEMYYLMGKADARMGDRKKFQHTDANAPKAIRAYLRGYKEQRLANLLLK